jgi:hypothetical protein
MPRVTVAGEVTPEAAMEALRREFDGRYEVVASGGSGFMVKRSAFIAASVRLRSDAAGTTFRVRGVGPIVVFMTVRRFAAEVADALAKVGPAAA